MQPAAPPPEGHRRGAVAAAGRRDPRPNRRGRMRHRPQRRLRRRRHRRVHRLRRPARRVLLHGDEHPAAGRTPGHRDGHRPRPRGAAGADRRGREAAARAGRHHHDWARRSRPASTPRIPARGFLPTGGTVLDVVGSRRRRAFRVDSGLAPGTVVGSDYDPMLAKVIAHAGDRSAALRGARPRAGRHRRARGHHQHRVPALPAGRSRRRRRAARHRPAGPPHRATSRAAQPGDDELIAAAAYRWLQRWPAAGADPWAVPSGWRVGQRAPTTIRLHAGERTDHVLPHRHPGCRDGRGRGRRNPLADSALSTAASWRVTLDGIATEYIVAADRRPDLAGRRRPHRRGRRGARGTGPPRRRTQR